MQLDTISIWLLAYAKLFEPTQKLDLVQSRFQDCGFSELHNQVHPEHQYAEQQLDWGIAIVFRRTDLLCKLQ